MNPTVFKETTKVAMGDVAATALLTALGLGAAAAIGGGMAYGGYRYGKGQDEADMASGSVGSNKPGVGTYLLGGAPGYLGASHGYNKAVATQ